MSVEYHLHGPPGCGKTTALARSWLPRAAERFGAEAVTVCSLTKTAAAEIGSRDLPIPRDHVGTLHAHAFRALGKPSLVEGEQKDWNDRHPSLALGGVRASVDDLDSEQALPGATLGDGLLQRMEVLRHRRVDKASWPLDVLDFSRRWEEWKGDKGLSDFTDLIETALDEVPVAPGAPKVLIVDEAQDSSALELALVRSWAQAAEYVVLAGDGDQAIYGWRGASARAFLDGPVTEGGNYELTQSYRVPRRVHARADAWIRQASHRHAVAYLPRDFEGEVRRGAGSMRNVEPMADALEKDLEQGTKVMALATCGYMLRSLIAELRKRGVLFHNPYRTKNGSWNPLRGGVDRLLGFLAPDTRLNGRDFRLWNLRELASWVDLVRADVLPRGAKAQIALLVRGQARREELPPITAAEGRTLLGEPLWNLMRSAFSTRTPDPVNWLDDSILESKRGLMAYAFEVARRRGLRALRAEPRLVVGTVHSVKGGEANHVHLLPDLSVSAMREWYTWGEPKDSVLRTMYVGMTRASETLTLHNPASRFSVPL